MCGLDKMDNMVCDVLGCPELAMVFGIQGEKKVKACANHSHNLTEKNLDLFDIKKISSISARDVAELQSRKAKQKQGKQNISELRTLCDQERKTATEQLKRNEARALRLIETCYQHNLQKVNLRHQEIERELQEMQSHIDSYVAPISMQLTRAEELLLNSMETFPKLLRVLVSDVAYTLSEFAVNSTMCSNDDVESILLHSHAEADLAENMRKSLERYSSQLALEEMLHKLTSSNANEVENKETIGYATKLVSLKLERELAVLQQIGSNKNASEAQSLIDGYVDAAHREFSVYHIDNSVRNWQSALSVLNFCFPQSKVAANAHFQLGLIYLHYLTRYQEAESSFQSSHAIEEFISPHSDDSCEVLNYLGFAQFRLNKYDEAVETLKVSAKTASFEVSAVAKCFLGALYPLSGRLELSEKILLDVYESSIHIPKVRALAASMLGDLWTDSKPREAEEKYREALSFFRGQADIHFANCLNNLGKLLTNELKLKEATESLTKAMGIYRSLPKSIDLAKCLTNLGMLLEKTNNHREAEESYREAVVIYRSLPYTVDMAMCVAYLGILIWSTNRLNEAEKLIKEAVEIYRPFPTTIVKGNWLCGLAFWLQQAKKIGEAEQLYREALDIFRYFLQSTEIAECLSKLGNMFLNTNRLSEAEEAYKEAIEVYRSFPKSIEMADCLNNLGIAFKRTNRLSGAEEAYKEAIEVYRSFPKSIEMAACLAGLGVVLQITNKLSEAEEAYKEVVEVYRSFSQMIDLAHSLLVLGDLLSQRNKTEASQCYIEARELYRQHEPNSTMISVCNQRLQGL